MASSRVAIVLGAGSNVGARVARQLTSDGYKVATVSRSGKGVGSNDVALPIAADLVDPSAVSGIFKEVRTKLSEPSVVVYNAAAYAATPDPLSLDLKTFQDQLAINTTSVFAAITEAVRSFDAIADKSVKGVFIYTGNILNEGPLLPLLTLGVGKAASAHLIQYAAKTYVEKGYGFYYADQRTDEGKPIGTKVDADAHAEFYSELIKKTEPEHYLQTFVKGKGYVKF